MERPDRPQTGHDVGLAQLEALCEAVGADAPRDAIVAFFRDAAGMCGVRSLTSAPRWSAISDDCTPFEFSVVLQEGPPAIRVLLEAQDDPAGPATYWQAGRRLTAWLASRFEVPLDRLGAIEDLFQPEDPLAYWSLWQSVDFRADRRPRVKIYLNPNARGRERAAGLVDEALSRLGCAAAPSHLDRLPRDPDDRLVVLSLDLVPGLETRVSVHVQFRRPSAEGLEELAALAPGTMPGDATAFLDAVTGRTDGAGMRSMFATVHLDCGHLDSAVRGRPGGVGLHVPAFPYCENDGVARDRVTRFLERVGLSTAAYERCVRAMARAPLEKEEGLHSFVSFTRAGGHPRVIVSFGSRVYYDRHGWIALDPSRWWPSPVPG
ncbi:MAG: hypothetical protein DMD79_10000 [Candidatus Rokuibacteriota bacterium]|nr:MAG: hypothetical protein DMD79_10000 [Candidatus Rokubacteria bacterium]